MTKKPKKYHYIYKTTNLKTGRFYIGMHSTDDLDDGYLGSGTRLRRSIRRHGKESFKLEILEFLPDRASLEQRETQLITEDLIKNPLCMNIIFGGSGGYISPKGCKKGGVVSGKKIADRLKVDNDFRKKHCDKSSAILKERWKNDSYRKNQLEKLNWTGRKHKPETIHKMREKAVQRTGQKNSQYGTCWITNSIISKKIKKGEPIPSGWTMGRKLNKMVDSSRG